MSIGDFTALRPSSVRDVDALRELAAGTLRTLAPVVLDVTNGDARRWPFAGRCEGQRLPVVADRTMDAKQAPDNRCAGPR
ncbi:hypothetical protein IHE30_09565 [Mycetohabitans sp. B46]